MSIWQLWLASQISAFGLLFLFTSFGLFILACILQISGRMLVAEADNDGGRIEGKLWLRRSTGAYVACFLLGALAAATPTRSSVYWIIGGYYVTNIDGIEDLPPNIIAAGNKFLETFNDEPGVNDD